jgi:hypothetical protein
LLIFSTVLCLIILEPAALAASSAALAFSMIAAKPRLGLAAPSVVGVVVPAAAAGAGLAATFKADFAGCVAADPEGLAVPRYAVVGGAVPEDAGLALVGVLL